MRERAAMEGRTDGKRAVGRLSGSCGSCQRLNSDKEKKKNPESFPLAPTFFGGRIGRRGGREKARIPKGRPVE